MKKVAVLYSEYIPVIDAIKCQLKNAEVLAFDSISQNYSDFDLIVSVNFKTKSDISILKSHYSLFPAFMESDEPVRDAMLYGNKVTGLTIYFNNPFKIVAQYPLMIPNSAHFDEVMQELVYLEQVIYPLVVEKVLNNETVDMKTLLSKGCSGNCGGCGGCNH